MTDDAEFGVERGPDELEPGVDIRTNDTEPAPPPPDMVPPRDRPTPQRDDLGQPVTVGETIEIVEAVLRRELAPIFRKIEGIDQRKHVSKGVLDGMSDKLDEMYGCLLGKTDENGVHRGGIRKEFEKYDARVLTLQATADATAAKLQEHAAEMLAMIGNEYLALVESNNRLRLDVDTLAHEVALMKLEARELAEKTQ